MGKSNVAYGLARAYGANVMEVDDIGQAVKAITTQESHPALHYWNTGINWMDVGVNGNVKWLIDHSKELVPAIRAIVENHIESDVPVIIEGDFIDPEFVASIQHEKVKAVFIHEPDSRRIS